MRLPENLLPKTKIVLHGVQGFVIFLAWAITIAIFTKPGSTDGRIKYFFALCWFCIPLLIYQAAVPQFDRTKRFSNVYAHAAIDALLAIFWFAAFISVATWTNHGIKNGVDKDKNKGCDAFLWGDGDSRGSKCRLSQATIGMGVVIFLLFIATTFISIKNALYYRRNGSLPHTTPTHQAHPLPHHANDDDDDQAKYAFSSNPHDDLDEDEDTGRHGNHSTYSVLHDTHNDTGGLHPDGRSPWATNANASTANLPRYDDPDRIDTSYHSTTTIAGGAPQLPPHRDPFRDRDPSPYRVQNHPPPAGLAEAEEDTGYRGRYQAGGAGEAGDPFRDDLALSHGYGGGSGAGEGRVDFPEGDYHR
ncbi:MAG: hypothetical protein Q9185_006550 [Variospora sp. 1 TL-2023]